jgi:hypothetical protein
VSVLLSHLTWWDKCVHAGEDSSRKLPNMKQIRQLINILWSEFRLSCFDPTVGWWSFSTALFNIRFIHWLLPTYPLLSSYKKIRNKESYKLFTSNLVLKEIIKLINLIKHFFLSICTGSMNWPRVIRRLGAVTRLNTVFFLCAGLDSAVVIYGQ